VPGKFGFSVNRRRIDRQKWASYQNSPFAGKET
jgi:hypothetical protein